jgi:hypothetical protein
MPPGPSGQQRSAPAGCATTRATLEPGQPPLTHQFLCRSPQRVARCPVTDPHRPRALRAALCTWISQWSPKETAIYGAEPPDLRVLTGDLRQVARRAERMPLCVKSSCVGWLIDRVPFLPRRLIVAVAPRSSRSFVLASLRALHLVPRLVAGRDRQQPGKGRSWRGGLVARVVGWEQVREWLGRRAGMRGAIRPRWR